MFFLNQEINLATTSNPKSKSKPRVRAWTSKNMNIKPTGKKKEHHQIKEHQQEQTQKNPHETTTKPNHPKNRNPAKHPTHPLPNQTIIKEISNTTTS